MSKREKHKYLLGIDEVGRGPLAGPVAVGAILIYAEHYHRVARLFPVIKDSKKLSTKARREWLTKIKEVKNEGLLEYSVAFVSSRAIDKKGIAPSIRTALEKALEVVNYLGPSSVTATEDGPRCDEMKVLLDGGLRAPAHYKNQKTIIKGDEKELVIALASIVAKVTRDAYMIKLGKKFPAYGFERHKGYGTRAHYLAIEKHGITPHHRKSYLKKKGVKDVG